MQNTNFVDLKNDLTVFKVLCIRIYWNFYVITVDSMLALDECTRSTD